MDEAVAKVKRQMDKNSCQRNAIEGRNGTGKCRFGLDLIISTLDENAKTEVALIILAMIASHRLVRWLVQFINFCRFWGRVLVFQ